MDELRVLISNSTVDILAINISHDNISHDNIS